MPRYYYNKDMDICDKFIYGGCGGNANNFYTIEVSNASTNVIEVFIVMCVTGLQTSVHVRRLWSTFTMISGPALARSSPMVVV
ncbi:unnamed protein product [Staurois parvus]|uniref:BPTI/Kunitz inhibitor domain-containing protein n=1 Tax=Staurois parvus TaxID=386267 RepID=A0ABN9BPV7_9NEOB|nr:unnamed protein product [Staurois parvus]